MYSSSGRNNRVARYPMLTLFDEVNRFFEDALPAAQSSRGLSTFNPPIDVVETEREYLIKGEFPGIEAEKVNIELKENTLTLSGEKNLEHEKSEGTRHYVERSFGSFTRTISFDSEIDEDNASAEMKNGLLAIKIPKAAKEVKGAKRLSVKAC